MSHFVVLVIGDDVEGQLEPYDENAEVAPHREYVDFTEGWRSSYFTSAHEYAVKYDLEPPADKTDAKRIVELSMLSMAEDAKAAGERLEDYVDRSEILHYDEEEGKAYYISTYNPDSKWDWYSVGGRWTGIFKLKDGSEGVVGSPGLMTEPAEEGRVDQALKGDIDFEFMREEKRVSANEFFDKLEAFIADNDIDVSGYRSWKEFSAPVIEMQKELEAGETEAVKAGVDLREYYQPYRDALDQARTDYHAQPVYKAFVTEEAREILGFFWNDSPVDIYLRGRETYVQDAVDGVAIPYAVLRHGAWIAQGEMGWFGLSSDDVSKDDWNKQVSAMYDEVSDDTLLTMVDCHI